MRRRLRTALTIFGITIGITALFVMSSLANKISSLIEGSSQYYQGKIIVNDANDPGWGYSVMPMSLEVATRIQSIPGIAVVVPQIVMRLDPDGENENWGPPDTLYGSVAGADQGYDNYTPTALRGRVLSEEDEGSNVVVLGSELAAKEKKEVGDSIVIREVEFVVIGILESTLSAPDTTAWIPLRAAQQLFANAAAAVIKQGIASDQMATQIVAYPEDGFELSDLAETIENDIGQVSTMTGEEFDEDIGSATAWFNAIIVGISLISLVVGGMSVVNTMAMSVSERTREIGVKRAIGASRSRIIREIVGEAGLIGFLGGGIGIVIGTIIVLTANQVGRSSGVVLFEITIATTAFALLFATVIGTIAGLIPAWNAARLDPVSALRHE